MVVTYLHSELLAKRVHAFPVRPVGPVTLTSVVFKRALEVKVATDVNTFVTVIVLLCVTLLGS